jgi:hypothetical protein
MFWETANKPQTKERKKMVTRKSALPPEERIGWTEQAARDMLQRETETMAQRIAEQAPALLASKAGKKAYRALVQNAKTEYREVEILTRKDPVGSKVRVFHGMADLPDNLELLRRVSKDLGIKAGSLPLEQAQEWTGIAARATDIPAGVKKNIIIDVQTGIMAETVKPFKVQTARPEQETLTREEYRAMLWSENKAMLNRAVKARTAGLVIG